jgi:hypothetical protein
MSKRLVVLAAILIVAAFAGTVTKLGNYEITLGQPTVVSGVTLKAGDYKLSVADTSVTIAPLGGGKSVDAPVKIETTAKKFDTTLIKYERNSNNETSITEIDLGGRKIKVLFVK